MCFLCNVRSNFAKKIQLHEFSMANVRSRHNYFLSIHSIRMIMVYITSAINAFIIDFTDKILGTM